MARQVTPRIWRRKLRPEVERKSGWLVFLLIDPTWIGIYSFWPAVEERLDTKVMLLFSCHPWKDLLDNWWGALLIRSDATEIERTKPLFFPEDTQTQANSKVSSNFSFCECVLLQSDRHAKFLRCTKNPSDHVNLTCESFLGIDHISKLFYKRWNDYMPCFQLPCN